jgi:hypothetical protein
MDAKSEARDLKQNPLPPVVIVDPLTRVWDLDRQISELSEQVAALSEQREQALKYAIDHNFREDSCCLLEVEQKVRKSRTLNIDRFREAFPEEYMTACDIERREKEEALNHIGERINITLVDKLVKKPVLEGAPGVITVKESVSTSYQVVRK